MTFPGLEKTILKFRDFSRFSMTVRTLILLQGGGWGGESISEDALMFEAKRQTPAPGRPFFKIILKLPGSRSGQEIKKGVRQSIRRRRFWWILWKNAEEEQRIYNQVLAAAVRRANKSFHRAA